MKRLLGLVALTLVLLVVDFKVIGFLLAVIIVVAGLAFFGDKRDLFNKVFNFDKKPVRYAMIAVPVVLLMVAVVGGIHNHPVAAHEAAIEQKREAKQAADKSALQAIKFSATNMVAKTDAKGKFIYRFTADAKQIDVDFTQAETEAMNASVKKVGHHSYELTGDIAKFAKSDDVSYTLYLDGERKQEKKETITVENLSDAHKKFVADRKAAAAASASKAASESAASESARKASSEARKASIAASVAASSSQAAAASAESQADQKQKADENAANYSYPLLMKSDDHFGEPYHLTGTVFQADSADEMENLLVDIDGDMDLVEVVVNGTTSAVEGSTVSIYGTIRNRTTYDKKIGGSNTVPTISASQDDITVQ